MEHPHSLSILAKNKSDYERVSDEFILSKLKEAQKKSWDILHVIRNELKEGMTELEARRLSMDVFRDHGVIKHWHRPYVRFGPGTLLSFHDPDQVEHRLQENDPIYFDLGPVWPDVDTKLEYEGDVGDSFSFGVNDKLNELKLFSHKLFNECQRLWGEQQLSGAQLYKFVDESCQGSPYTLNHEVAGHRVSDFPHMKYSKERLNAIEFVPEKGLWIFEIHILDLENNMGCFIENTLGQTIPGPSK